MAIKPNQRSLPRKSASHKATNAGFMKTIQEQAQLGVIALHLVTNCCKFIGSAINQLLET